MNESSHFCEECLKDFTDKGFRIYFCSQICWYRYHRSVKDGTWINKYPEEEQNYVNPEIIEPCVRKDFESDSKKVGCLKLVTLSTQEEDRRKKQREAS